MVRELGGRDRLRPRGGRSSRSSTRSAGSTASSGARSTRSASSSSCSACASCGATSPERAAIYTVIAAVIKPQLGILIPLVAVVTIRRALWPAGGSRRPASDRQAAARPRRPAWRGFADRGRACACRSGCRSSRPSDHRRRSSTPVSSPGRGRRRRLPVPDRQRLQPVGARARRPRPQPRQRRAVGLRLRRDRPISAARASAVFGADAGRRRRARRCCSPRSRSSLVVVARRPDRLTLLVGLAVLALAFFVVPTRVHERYGFPFFALGVILAAISWRWRDRLHRPVRRDVPNMYVVLTTLYPNNPSIQDWLGIGPAIRSTRAWPSSPSCTGRVRLGVPAAARRRARAARGRAGGRVVDDGDPAPTSADDVLVSDGAGAAGRSSAEVGPRPIAGAARWRGRRRADRRRGRR